MLSVTICMFNYQNIYVNQCCIFMILAQFTIIISVEKTSFLICLCLNYLKIKKKTDNELFFKVLKLKMIISKKSASVTKQLSNIKLGLY